MRTRLLLVVTVLAAIGLVAPPAGASVDRTYAVSDPQDVAIPKGDALRLRVIHGANNVVLLLDVRRGSYLGGDHGWSKFASTNLLVPLDTQGTGAVDYYVRVHTDQSGILSDVFREEGVTDTYVGPGSFTQTDDHTTFRLTIPRYLLDNPTEVRTRVVFAWDGNQDGTIDSRDRVPDSGFTPQVHRG